MIKRLKSLVIKIISVKGCLYITATIAMFLGKIDPWTWLLAGLTWVSIRMVEKILVKKDGQG